MKKSFLVICMLLSAISIYSASFVYAPYKGFAGIPIGNTHFKGGSHWSYPYNDEDPNHIKSSSGGGAGFGQQGDDTYEDAEMLALVSLPNIESSYYDKKWTLSVTCPNGMYMVSMSQPTFKRPIEIYLYPVANYATITNKSPIKLSNSNPIAVYDPGITSQPKGNWALWFDVVLVLPVDDNGMDNENDRLTVDGNVYPLIRTNDYSAIVTVTIDFEGADAPISFTMPFTGYYDGNTSSSSDGTPISYNNAKYPVAVDINTYPEATNIHLEVSNRGRWIDVGHLVFLLNGTNNAALFLSSSHDPFVAGDTFKMTKDDLAYNAPITSVNSIGFTARLIDTNGNVKIFEGDEYVASSVSSVSDIPDNFLHLDTLTIRDFKDDGSHGSVSYKEYQAEISIMLDSVDATLLSGRYEEEIYCHVLIE